MAWEVKLDVTVTVKIPTADSAKDADKIAAEYVLAILRDEKRIRVKIGHGRARDIS